MTKSIDFYSKDKHIGYVRNQVIGIIKEAIRKFDERKAAMVNALTGEDQLFETFEPPPTEPSIASSLQENTAAPPLMPNEYGIQEQPVENIGLGENLTQITESVAAEADGNASMTNNASSDTQGNMHLKSKASSNDETTFIKTSTTPEDNTVALLADERNVCTDDSNGFSPAMSQDDISLEIDLGSLSHDTEIIKTFKTAKDQDQNFKDLNDGYSVKKDPGEAVLANYMSYTGSDVPNVAKAARCYTAQKEQKDKQPKESSRKKGKKSSETVIIINNCKVVQIGEQSAIHTKDKSNNVQKNSANHETSLTDLSLCTQSSGSETSWNNFSLNEKYEERRTEILTTEDTFISGLESRDLFADNIPSDLSDASQKFAQSFQGVREAEEHDEGPEEPGSDTDYFLSK